MIEKSKEVGGVRVDKNTIKTYNSDYV